MANISNLCEVKHHDTRFISVEVNIFLTDASRYQCARLPSAALSHIHFSDKAGVTAQLRCQGHDTWTKFVKITPIEGDSRVCITLRR